jgi:branched-chain amino acid aminotransferase
MANTRPHPDDSDLEVYIDGKFYGQDDAKITVYDHGFLYGDSIYEGIRAYDGVVFRLEDHIARLYESAKTIGMKLPMKRREFIELVVNVFRHNGLSTGYCRVVVTRGGIVGQLGLDPRHAESPHIVIILSRRQLTPRTDTKPLRVIVSSFRRTPLFCVPATIKSTNYLNNILAKMEALNAGADDVILLDWRGYVAECSGSNIFLVKDEAVLTPPLTASILPGISRKEVIDLCEKMDIPMKEVDLSFHDLFNADEAFIAGTGPEVQAIGEISGRDIGDGREGPITRRIHERFMLEAPRTGTPIFPEEVIKRAQGSRRKK